MTYYNSTYYLDADNVSSKEQLEKERDQLIYTNTHISNVQTAWNMIKTTPSMMEYITDLIKNKTIPCNYIYTDGFIHMMNIQISLHDNSKYGPYEWEPYRKHFYPINDKEKEENKDDFDAAWVHHYTENKHHWNYWYKIYKDADAMDLLSVLELCCDWIAMNFVFKGTALDFYRNRVEECKDKDEQIYLGEKQKVIIKKILEMFYEEYPKNDEKEN